MFPNKKVKQEMNFTQCKCTTCHIVFVVSVPDDVENALSGEPYFHNTGEASNYGFFICHRGHSNTYEVVIGGSGDERVSNDLGSWLAVISIPEKTA